MAKNRGHHLPLRSSHPRIAAQACGLLWQMSFLNFIVFHSTL